MGLLVSSGFLGAKAGHSHRAVWRVEESCFCFWKAKETALLKKQAKFKGEGIPTLSMRWFPLSLFIYPKLCSFGLLLKMRCIFFTEQSYTDQGSTPGPLSLFCAKALCKAAKSAAFCGCLPVFALELGTLFPNSAQAEFGGFGLRV